MNGMTTDSFPYQILSGLLLLASYLDIKEISNDVWKKLFPTERDCGGNLRETPQRTS